MLREIVDGCWVDACSAATSTTSFCANGRVRGQVVRVDPRTHLTLRPASPWPMLLPTRSHPAASMVLWFIAPCTTLLLS